MIKMKDVFQIASTGNETKMALFITETLTKMGLPYNIDDFGNISVIKGQSKTYPMFCCHLDTVHTYCNGYHLHEKDNSLFALDNLGKQVGVGGDDKSGIYVCIKLLETIPAIKVVFFSCEETGGIGSSYFDENFFSDCRFIGSVDRKGAKDFASSYAGQKRVSADFLNAIQDILVKHGRKEVVGGFTDAFNVEAGVSCFNMSCGYYNPHTNMETVSIKELEETLQFCTEIALTAVDVYPFTYIKPVYAVPTFGTSTKYNKYDGLYEDDWYSDYGYGSSWDSKKEKTPFEKSLDEHKIVDKTYLAEGLAKDYDIRSISDFYNIMTELDPWEAESILYELWIANVIEEDEMDAAYEDYEEVIYGSTAEFSETPEYIEV